MLPQLDAPAAPRSERVQLICGQAGIGDELRLLLRADGVAWGAAQFCRESGSPHFDDAERGFIADLAPEIGAGLRRSLSHRVPCQNSFIAADLALRACWLLGGIR